MNLRRPLYAMLILSAVAELGGCKALLKKKDPEPAPSAAPIAAPPTVIAPLPEATAALPPQVEAPKAFDENAVPTPQDFEDEAFEKVTAANFKAQFASLKTAVGK